MMLDNNKIVFFSDLKNDIEIRKEAEKAAADRTGSDADYETVLHNIECGLRVKYALKAEGIKQKDLAEKVGVTAQYISMIITGKSELSLTNAAAFCSVFRFPYRPDYFLCLSDDKFGNFNDASYAPSINMQALFGKVGFEYSTNGDECAIKRAGSTKAAMCSYSDIENMENIIDIAAQSMLMGLLANDPRFEELF